MLAARSAILVASSAAALAAKAASAGAGLERAGRVGLALTMTTAPTPLIIEVPRAGVTRL